tara:strand:- start:373 stop:1095 length:723 start_codon:yes stop_codon:yes gene_type:complete
MIIKYIYIYIYMELVNKLIIFYFISTLLNNSNIKFTNPQVNKKYNSLVKRIGNPQYIEYDNDNNNIDSVKWQLPLDEFQDRFGYFYGCDMIKLHNKPSKKWHPYPAQVFVIVGKYLPVPEHLFGPLKYASETINIEQLFVPKEYADNYYKTGNKEYALVTGSCASVTISVITIQFVIDMIKKYNQVNSGYSDEQFSSEYDRRIRDYLCGKGITDPITWFKSSDFNEDSTYYIGDDKCKQK